MSFTTGRKTAAKSLPPILAGIRACKSDRATFPCELHSGVETQPAWTGPCACLPLRGQHTLAPEPWTVPQMRIVFPV